MRFYPLVFVQSINRQSDNRTHTVILCENVRTNSRCLLAIDKTVYRASNFSQDICKCGISQKDEGIELVLQESEIFQVYFPNDLVEVHQAEQVAGIGCAVIEHTVESWEGYVTEKEDKTQNYQLMADIFPGDCVDWLSYIKSAFHLTRMNMFALRCRENDSSKEIQKEQFCEAYRHIPLCCSWRSLQKSARK